MCFYAVPVAIVSKTSVAGMVAGSLLLESPHLAYEVNLHVFGLSSCKGSCVTAVRMLTVQLPA